MQSRKASKKRCLKIMIFIDFGLQNGAKNRTEFHRVFTFQPLEPFFGPTSELVPPKTAPRPHFGCFLHNLGCFFDEFGKILAQFGIILQVFKCPPFFLMRVACFGLNLGSIFGQTLQNHAKRCKIFCDAFLYKQA